MAVDSLRYYDLDRYLFEDVHARFRAEGSLSAFDLFSIVIWKAKRAKSRVARNSLTSRRKIGVDAIVLQLKLGQAQVSLRLAHGGEQRFLPCDSRN